MTDNNWTVAENAYLHQHVGDGRTSAQLATDMSAKFGTTRTATSVRMQVLKLNREHGWRLSFLGNTRELRVRVPITLLDALNEQGDQEEQDRLVIQALETALEP